MRQDDAETKSWRWGGLGARVVSPRCCAYTSAVLRASKANPREYRASPRTSAMGPRTFHAGARTFYAGLRTFHADLRTFACNVARPFRSESRKF